MKRKVLVLFAFLFVFAFTGISFSASETNPDVYKLLAGQHIEVGQINVWNDSDKLYVQYEITDMDWLITETHCHVGIILADFPTTKKGSPIPGQFDYSDVYSPGETKVTIEIPMIWAVNDVVLIATHAVVVNTNFANETAWGDGTRFVEKGNWGMYFPYTITGTPGPTPSGHWEEETAWVDGNPYNIGGGNWATYTPYNHAAMNDVPIYAGQTLLVGHADFSAPDGNGNVTITIKLDVLINSEYSQFQNVGENLKIQDYAVAPSGNPSPGTFNYKFTDQFQVTVPDNNFYGIHLDVEWWKTN